MNYALNTAFLLHLKPLLVGSRRLRRAPGAQTWSPYAPLSASSHQRTRVIAINIFICTTPKGVGMLVGWVEEHGGTKKLESRNQSS